MKCPNCGAENRDGGKFCRECGAPLIERVESGAEPADVTPGPSDDGNTPGIVARLKGLGARQRAIAGGVAAAIVLAVVAIIALGGGRGLSDQRVLDDFAAYASDVSLGGTYNADAPFEVVEAKITQNEKYSLSELEEAFLGADGDDWREVRISGKLSNGSVEINGNYKGYYCHTNDGWQLVSSITTDGTPSYTAIAGPDEDKVLEQVDSILSTASGVTFSSGNNTLSGIYEADDMTIADSDFKDSTATVTLHGVHDSTFYTAEGDVTATFAFESGRWTLESAKASDGATKPDYSKIVGEWVGEFDHQSANWNSKCYGAKDSTLTIKIDSVDNNTMQVKGTFSCMAHYHNAGDNDADSTEGDTMLEDVPFSVTLESGYYISGFSESLLLGADYTTPEEARGSVTLDFGLGTSSAPDSFVAAVETESEVGKVNWYSQTRYWTDVYKMKKSQ